MPNRRSENPKSHFCTARLTRSEFEALNAAAAVQQVPKSDLLRNAVLKAIANIKANSPKAQQSLGA